MTNKENRALKMLTNQKTVLEISTNQNSPQCPAVVSRMSGGVLSNIVSCDPGLATVAGQVNSQDLPSSTRPSIALDNQVASLDILDTAGNGTSHGHILENIFIATSQMYLARVQYLYGL